MPVDELSVDGVIKLLETAMTNKMTWSICSLLDREKPYIIENYIRGI